MEPALPRITVPSIQEPFHPGSGVIVSLRDNLTGASPRQPTSVSLARTTDTLHLLFECHDAHPWATHTRRDAPLYQEEVIEVFIDPFGDLECYFEIELNPLNAVMDLMLRRIPSGWRKQIDWQCEGLQTSVAITPVGWTASLAIPFAAMTSQRPAPGDCWRANFLRIDRPPAAPRDLSAWSPTARNTFHIPSHFGYLDFA